MTRNTSNAALTTMRSPSLRPLEPRFGCPSGARRASDAAIPLMLRAGPPVPDGGSGSFLMARFLRWRGSSRRPPTFVTTDDGVALATSVTPSNNDAPTLLLVHGFGGAKEDFADHVEALARHHRVVTFDLRGHGESDAPDEPSAYSLDRLAADVLAVADALRARQLPAARALDGRHGRAPGGARPPRPSRRARAHGHVRRALRPASTPISCASAPSVAVRERHDRAAPAPRRGRPVGVGRAPARRRRTAGLPRVRRPQVVDAVAGDVEHARGGAHRAAGSARRAPRRWCVPRSCSSARRTARSSSRRSCSPTRCPMHGSW